MLLSDFQGLRNFVSEINYIWACHVYDYKERTAFKKINTGMRRSLQCTFKSVTLGHYQIIPKTLSRTKRICFKSSEEWRIIIWRSIWIVRQRYSRKASSFLASVAQRSKTFKTKRWDFLVVQWTGIACQHKGHRFNPWSGKMPHTVGQLSLCTRAHKWWLLKL